MRTKLLPFRLVAVACLLTLTPFTAACGVIFGGTRQGIQVNSSPTGATINTAPQTVTYTTPTQLSLPRKNDYTLTFSMPGYASQQAQIQRDMRVGILVADILLTGVIGVIVDAATGAWYRLSPETVSVSLTKTATDLIGPDTITVTIRSTGEGIVQVESSVPGVTVATPAQ